MPNGEDKMSQIETEITEKQIIACSIANRIKVVEGIIDNIDIEKAELCFEIDKKLEGLLKTREYLYDELGQEFKDTAKLVQKYLALGDSLEKKV